MNVATEQTMSIEEMENLLFGDYNGTIDYNFTTVGFRDLIDLMLDE